MKILLKISVIFLFDITMQDSKVDEVESEFVKWKVSEISLKY